MIENEKQLEELRQIAEKVGGPQEPWNGETTRTSTAVFGAFTRYARDSWQQRRSFCHTDGDTVRDFLRQVR